MQIYNTLTKKKEEFIPLDPPNVTMYVCGPTVYDYFHIGNARSFVVSDIIYRYLEYKGYKVKYVMNLTDVDDKLIKKANEEGITTAEVSKRYIDAFFEDIDKLKIKRATVYPKATEHMQEITDLIKKIEENSYAYETEGEVFFDVAKFDGYGKLSGKNIDDLESGARVEINDKKRNPLDFSLWKKAKDGEPFWDSPWSKGRPGWHIECSAMSMKHLGESFDIHAGGNDLIFPHHENEIAQSGAGCNGGFAKYWIHFGFLNIRDEKMSKSLGNFFTAREVLNKYSAEAIRFLFNQAHYSSPLNYSSDLIESSKKGLEKISSTALKIKNEIEKGNNTGENPDFNFNNYYTQFEAAMDDNFNSPKAIAVIFDFVRDVNAVIAKRENLSLEFYKNAKLFLEKTAEQVLGILHFDELHAGQGPSLENDLIELLTKLRASAKADKNYQLSDQIRDGLKEIGITLQDSKTGTTFTKD
ncbi:MAG: cysteine--tRNA ligase [Ignavibacteriae bacterium]|nr:cysteine--tRNA ligase [Ignavibacteriota bacterium]NOG99425.1 cysteine--tRNA ligase [Ignavibacteriota bacterium]